MRWFECFRMLFVQNRGVCVRPRSAHMWSQNRSQHLRETSGLCTQKKWLLPVLLGGRSPMNFGIRHDTKYSSLSISLNITDRHWPATFAHVCDTAESRRSCEPFQIARTSRSSRTTWATGAKSPKRRFRKENRQEDVTHRAVVDYNTICEHISVSLTWSESPVTH